MAATSSPGKHAGPPVEEEPAAKRQKTDDTIVYMVASGDLRHSANKVGWPVQAEMEAAITKAVEDQGFSVKRAHEFDPQLGHGFIYCQRQGMDVFRKIPRTSPVIVAEAVWEYSHHVLAGLRTHKGPIITIANWSGTHPGLVGLLNLNASMTKAGIEYSTVWSENFDDEFFLTSLKTWLNDGIIRHDVSHVRDFDLPSAPAEHVALGFELAQELAERKAIMGVFDEGCMGMYNAIFDDELINPFGLYKERLSQSALLAGMSKVTDAEADDVRAWLVNKGFTFKTGSDEATELTDAQLHTQFKMYIAAVRIAADFGCDLIGIQYQQGLKDMAPASDLVEGLLNNVDRPPVYHAETKEELYPGAPLPHFNEVDEGVAVDALFTNIVWTRLGLDPATTLHDVRWGEHYGGDVNAYVWVFLISGSVPASHNVGGYAGSCAERQPPMYFPLGGGTLKGVSKPGEIVWSRVYIAGGVLHADLGRATIVELPEEETQRRWEATTPQWPIMHAVLHGVSRDQFMAHHKANHLNVAYGDDAASANKALAVKAAMFHEAGLIVHLIGDVNL